MQVDIINFPETKVAVLEHHGDPALIDRSVQQFIAWRQQNVSERESATIPGIRRINLTVVTQQEAALRLYQSLGFQIYGTEQETFSRAGHFYDEHLLTLNLVSDNVA
jgi:hypothetical protein